MRTAAGCCAGWDNDQRADVSRPRADIDLRRAVHSGRPWSVTANSSVACPGIKQGDRNHSQVRSEKNN